MDTVARRLPRVVMVAALLATIVGLVIVERIGDSYRATVDIAVDSARLAASVAEPAAELPQALLTVTDAVDDTLSQVATAIESSSAAANDLAIALQSNVALAVEGVATVADRLASFIEAVERFIPGDTESLAEDLRRIADGLAPAPDQLRTLGDQLAAAAGDVAATSAALEEISAGLDEVDAGIAEAGEALDDLPGLLADVEAEAVRTRDRVGSDVWLLRLLVVLGGLTIAGLAFSVDRLSDDVRRSARSGTRP
jgi:ABC-type transporter Mla subunit MlaD